jgi:hypothetical protein
VCRVGLTGWPDPRPSLQDPSEAARETRYVTNGQTWPASDRHQRETGRHRRKGSEELLALALAQGKTFAEAAAAGGVAERTARRRAGDSHVVSAVEAYRALLLERASAKLLAQLDRGIDALAELIGSDSEVIRLRAAATLIDKAVAVREVQSFEGRLRAVEEMAAQVQEPEEPDPRAWPA